MSAPARKRKGRAPNGNPDLFTPPSDNAKSNADADEFDFDRRMVDQVDWSIWQALYRGDFRLAVRCRRCGRWLTDGRSKRNHLGPRCAVKAGGDTHE